MKHARWFIAAVLVTAGFGLAWFLAQSQQPGGSGDTAGRLPAPPHAAQPTRADENAGQPAALHADTGPALPATSAGGKQGDAVKPQVARAPAASPAERSLTIDGALDTQRASQLLASDPAKFRQFVDALRSESSTNPLAADVQSLYGDYLSRYVAHAASDHLQLGDMACGRTFCVGSVTATAPDASDAWSRVFDAEGAPPVFTMTQFDRTGADGEPVEHRFIFSTDPASSDVSVKLSNP